MLSTNANFDTKHALAQKWPLYTAHIDGSEFIIGENLIEVGGRNPDDGDTYWSKDRVSIDSVGGIVCTTMNTGHRIYKEYTELETGVQYSFSFKAKPNLRDWIRVGFWDGYDQGFVYFNINTGATGTDNDPISYSIGSADADGYRECQIIFTPDALASQFRIDIYVAEDDGDINLAGDGSDPAIWVKKFGLYTPPAAQHTSYVCNYVPENAANSYVRILEHVSGLAQTVTPEKGLATIGSIAMSLLDYDGTVTDAIGSHSTNFHRAKVIIKAGYKGMDEADLLTVATYWITSARKSGKGGHWTIEATDPQKWLQKTVFRDASEASPVVLAGNAINILLSVLTSSDSGTNSDYDMGDEDFGCGLDSDTCDIAAIEQVRDRWYWGATHFLYFSITEKQKAKDFIEKEILKVLNCYPSVTAEGKYSIIRYQPPIPTSVTVQSFTEANIIDIPDLNLNFDKTINQIDFKYDWDGSEFDTEYYAVDATSYSDRGNSYAPLKIESKGLHSDMTPWSVGSQAAEIRDRRADAVFQRYADPPPKLTVRSLFDRYLSEAGDIVPVTHSGVPNISSGTLGLVAESMEIVNRRIDWKSGKATFDMLSTGFTGGVYSAASPYMTITSGSSATAFNVSVADAALYTEGWEAKILNANLREIATVTILTINTGTGAITCDSIGETPAAGWYVVFADYDDCTAAQQEYGFVADASGGLGTDNDAAHISAA